MCMPMKQMGSSVIGIRVEPKCWRLNASNASPIDLRNSVARFASNLCPPSAPRDAYCRCRGLVGLALADPEYLRPARRTYALSSRLLVLQGDWFRVLDLHFLPALHAIGLHVHTSSRVGGGYTIEVRVSSSQCVDHASNPNRSASYPHNALFSS